MTETTPSRPKKQNAAYRLYLILEQMSRTDGRHLAAIECWASVLGVETAEPAKSLQVAREIGLLYEALLETQEQLVVRGVDQDLYGRQFAALASGLRVHTLSAPFSDLGNVFSPAALQTLLLLSQTLDADESEGQHDAIIAQIKELSELILELKGMLFTSELPISVKRFLSRHLSIVQQGLRDYRIKGPSVFRDTYVKTVIHARERPPEVDEHADSKEAQGVGHLIVKIRKLAELAMVSDRLITAVAGTTEKLIPYISGFLPPGNSQ